MVDIVLAREVFPFGFLADEPAGQTEVAEIADHAIKTKDVPNDQGMPSPDS